MARDFKARSYHDSRVQLQIFVFGSRNFSFFSSVGDGHDGGKGQWELGCREFGWSVLAGRGIGTGWDSVRVMGPSGRVRYQVEK